MSDVMQSWQIDAVLFDLDGTLVDTAPDLAAALNATLIKSGRQPLPYESIRPIVSNGANGLIELGFSGDLTVEEHDVAKSHLITYYQQHIADKSVLFEGLEEALIFLENNNIPWGIVTNKPEYLTTPLLKAMALYDRTSCVVSGDQVKNPKPHPESIYLACKEINISPAKAIYIGDAERDIRAGRLAGLKTIACAYGYVPVTENINDWQADVRIDSSTELLTSLQLLA